MHGGGAAPEGTFTLLQGLDNKVLEADRALWHLAQEAGAAGPSQRHRV
jgi:hypothetical protein